MIHKIPESVDCTDIEYFKKKLEIAKDPDLKIKIAKQIEMLEDAVVIYRIGKQNV
ncbi:MAG TPA: hypothetical protein VFM18_17320 [Methanosarcina sp.]|nr:hypothetical protein [Methanosarcina sp.]